MNTPNSEVDDLDIPIWLFFPECPIMKWVMLNLYFSTFMKGDVS